MISDKYFLEIIYLGLIFFISLLLSIVLTSLSSRVALFLGIVDQPDVRKIHSTPIPCTGGLAMAASLFLSIFICLRLTPEVKGFLSGGAIVVFFGALDDRFLLSPKLKFLGEILAAVVFMFVGKISLYSLGDILGLGEIRLFFLGPWVTVFCMVGVMNALNLSDGLDGLAGGISAIACFFLFIFAYVHNNWSFASIVIILLGVIAGFLRYNSHPAKLFMGDTGSLLLGYSLSATAVAIVRSSHGSPNVAPISVAIVLALPIVDTVWVMLRRLIKGEKTFNPDKTHLHHRLLELGLSHSSVVAILYCLMSFFGFWAWSIRKWPEWIQFYSTLGIVVSIYCLVAFLEKHKIRMPAKIKFDFKLSFINEFLNSSWIKHSVRIVMPVFIFAFLSPFFFLPATNQHYGLLALVMILLLALFFPWHGGKRQVNIAHGFLYLACFSCLFIYNFAFERYLWLPWYLQSISLIALLWVMLRVLFRRSAHALLLSSFEILFIITSVRLKFLIKAVV
jgi:UDP-GlcNAc:undecaprenyl-phosphate GlcNAc-1-phosphate transferase